MPWEEGDEKAVVHPVRLSVLVTLILNLRNLLHDLYVPDKLSLAVALSRGFVMSE